jgi:hypothetical protein
MSPPRLRYFLTCDGAQIQNGKVTAIGLFDTVVSAMYPAVHGSMAVVLGFEGQKAATYALGLAILAPDGKELGRVDGPELVMTGHAGTVSQVLELRGLQFPTPGDYRIQVLLDGSPFSDQVLHICEPPRPQIRTAEELEALLKTPDVITSATSELQCDKCKTVFRFQVHLDPSKPRDPGFLPPPPSKVFVCGTCGNRINSDGVAANLRRLLGLHRSWLPIAPQQAPEGKPADQELKQN